MAISEGRYSTRTVQWRENWRLFDGLVHRVVNLHFLKMSVIRLKTETEVGSRQIRRSHGTFIYII